MSTAKPIDLALEAEDTQQDWALSGYLNDPPQAFPTEHHLWEDFLDWLNGATFINRNILSGDWGILWQIYVSIRDGH